MLTAPECLSARLVAISPLHRRATARSAEVRLKSDGGPHDAHPQIQNRTTFNPGTGVRAPRTAAHLPCSTLQLIWRSLKSHR